MKRSRNTVLSPMETVIYIKMSQEPQVDLL